MRDVHLATSPDELGLDLSGLNRREEGIGSGGEAIGHHGLRLPQIGARSVGAGDEGVHLLLRQDGPEIGAHHVHSGAFAGPTTAGIGGGGGARRGTAAEPCVHVDERNFGDEAAVPVADCGGVIEARGVEGCEGDAALAEGDAEGGERLIGPQVPGFGAHGGEDALQGGGGLGATRAGIAGGNAVGVGRGVGAAKGVGQGQRLLCGKGCGREQEERR